MISDTHKCIFIHISRTAGTSIENARAIDFTGLYRHWVAEQFARKFPEKWKKYFTFTVVRNPWDRAVSIYRWRRTTGRLKRHKTFNSWIRTRPKLGEQSANIKVAGKVDVDFIGRFERLQRDFNHICRTLGVPTKKLPHVNKTRRGEYTSYYRKRDVAIVRSLFPNDVEIFGYEFGD